MKHFVLSAVLGMTVLATGALASGPAWAQARVALVVGNGSYGAVPGLDNPTADARLMADSLRTAGFDVTLLLDGDQIALKRAISQFGRDLRSGGADTTGLFYYAGHGVQSFGSNYLLPVDVSLTDAADLSLVAIEADAVLRQMRSARNRTNIVILDACRDNPFVAIPNLDDNGLAEMNAPTGTFLSYSTAPGNVALDGFDGNSPFTSSLARHIVQPGLPIEQMFKSVRIDVLRATNGRQVPWDTSSLTGDFTFMPAATPEPADPVQALWESIKDSADPVPVLLFLRAHPESEYTDAARALLSRIIASEAAGTPPPEAVAEPAPAPAAPAPAAPVVPTASEQEMIEIARTSGARADYQAYLDAYPQGVYGELAAFEISILDEKAARETAAVQPAAAAPAVQPTVQPAAQPVVQPAPAEPAEAAPVTFDHPLDAGGTGIAGKTLEQLIAGSPLFPPIEGLPEEYWKEQTCSNCHEWQRENLCTQGQTYLAANAERALSKRHPYGGGFKANLRRWAQNDCR